MTSQSSTGFSLIEVLVSMAILSIAITGAMSVSTFGFDHLSRTRDHQAASQFAHSHLAELKHQNDLSPGTYSGQYSDHYRWNLVISSLTTPEDENSANSVDPTNPVRALQLDLRVVFEGGERRLHSLILRSSRSNSSSKANSDSSPEFSLRSNNELRAG